MDTKSAFIAIVGKPNVGKSSLLNKIVGEKIAIISAKPQTTRTRITGVLTQDKTQFVFFDTPGLHRPKNRLSEYMVKQVRESVADVDAAVLVVEPDCTVTHAEKDFIQNFKDTHMPAILAINKIDIIKQKEQLIEVIAAYKDLYEFSAILPLSAKTGDGVTELLQELQQFAIESPHFFPDDALTDQPERIIAAELIREKILNNMQQEIPHGIAVGIDKMQERAGQNMMDIMATIYCERQNHKGMLIGKQGRMLKKIASEARADMEDFFGIKVYLECWVKVKEDWRNKESVIRDFGFQ